MLDCYNSKMIILQNF